MSSPHKHAIDNAESQRTKTAVTPIVHGNQSPTQANVPALQKHLTARRKADATAPVDRRKNASHAHETQKVEETLTAAQYAPPQHQVIQTPTRPTAQPSKWATSPPGGMGLKPSAEQENAKKEKFDNDFPSL